MSQGDRGWLHFQDRSRVADGCQEASIVHESPDAPVFLKDIYAILIDKVAWSYSDSLVVGGHAPATAATIAMMCLGWHTISLII